MNKYILTLQFIFFSVLILPTKNKSKHDSIERKSKARLNASADLSHISSYTESFDLALLLAEYPEILSGIHESLDPSVLVTYLFNLAAMVGQANRVLRVKGMEVEVAEARWLVFWAAKRVFEEGLMLLGLEFLERM